MQKTGSEDWCIALQFLQGFRAGFRFEKEERRRRRRRRRRRTKKLHRGFFGFLFVHLCKCCSSSEHLNPCWKLRKIPPAEPCKRVSDFSSQVGIYTDTHGQTLSLSLSLSLCVRPFLNRYPSGFVTQCVRDHRYLRSSLIIVDGVDSTKRGGWVLPCSLVTPLSALPFSWVLILRFWVDFCELDFVCSGLEHSSSKIWIVEKENYPTSRLAAKVQYHVDCSPWLLGFKINVTHVVALQLQLALDYRNFLWPFVKETTVPRDPVDLQIIRYYLYSVPVQFPTLYSLSPPALIESLSFFCCFRGSRRRSSSSASKSCNNEGEYDKTGVLWHRKAAGSAYIHDACALWYLLLPRMCILFHPQWAGVGWERANRV